MRMPPSLPPNLFADRTAGLQPFLVMEVLERAQELEREGRSIIHLEVGEPDFATPPEITEAGARAVSSGDTRYTHSLGRADLREAIAERYRRVYGVALSPERLLVTAGSSLGLLYVFGALVRPGDEVIAATPHYPCYPNFIGFFGGKLVSVPTDPEDGFRLDPERAAAAVTPRTRAILLNSPANPTGAVLDAPRLKALAEIGVPIVSDEIYHGLTYDAPARSILEFTDNAYVLDGFSKRYAMTGWRLGYVAAPTEAMRTLQVMQQSFLISPTAFVQAAGLTALREADASVEAMRQVYDSRRRLMVARFRELGFGVPVMPQGAFYVFADASRFTQDAYAFAFDLLEKTGVAVTPGIDFGEAGRRFIRLSYASSEANIEEAARRLAEYLPPR